MGRAAHRDARRARPGRRHPHTRPVSAALRPAPADRALLRTGRVRRAAAARDGDGLPPRRSRAARALELSRVGAGRACDRRRLTRALAPHDQRHGSTQGRPVPGRAGAADVAPDAADPPVRRKGGGSVRARQDRRVLSPLHRSGGKGGSMHLFDAAKRFMGGHGIVGGHVPLAAGIGFAIKYQGGDQVCLCYFGEAAVNIGAFHEALNMSSVYHLPVIFCCENNRYGMGTAFERVAAVTDVVEHACSYDMAAELVNGMDALAVYAATQRAVERARQGGHPTLLEVRTYRFMGHSMSDPLHGVYRTKDEVEEQKKRDPIIQLAAQLKEDGALDQAGVDALDAEVRAEVEEAVKFADESPDPEPAELFTHVLTD